MAAARADLDLAVVVAQELEHFAECLSRNDKVEASVEADRFAAQSEAVTVDGDDVEHVVFNFKQAAWWIGFAFESAMAKSVWRIMLFNTLAGRRSVSVSVIFGNSGNWRRSCR